MDCEFKVKVSTGDVYINDEFVQQLCWDEDAIGCAIANWLKENCDKEDE